MTEHNQNSTSSQKQNLFGRLITGGLRLFFKLLYHPLAWSYDWVASAVSVGRWQGWVQATAGMLQGERILELGFGPGHLQALLHQRGVTVFGLDESMQMVRQARRRLVKNGSSPRLARGLAQDLPFPDEVIDSVVATFPTLYIVDPKTLASIRRVLVPGGRMVVLMTAWITGNSLRERSARALNQATGQTPPEDQELTVFLNPYQEAGFEASLRFVEQAGSRLMFILAKKPMRSSNE
jgi:SAM-dependent methyltransferase